MPNRSGANNSRKNKETNFTIGLISPSGRHEIAIHSLPDGEGVTVSPRLRNPKDEGDRYINVRFKFTPEGIEVTVNDPEAEDQAKPVFTHTVKSRRAKKARSRRKV